MMGLVSMLATALLAQTADPLAPAREGKLRCVSPNPAKRTCESIIRYKPGATGGFDATVVGLVSRQPAVLLRYKTFGRIEEGGVCSVVRLTDFERGELLAYGLPLAGTAERTMRLRVMDSVQPMAGKKRCFIDRPSEDGKSIVAVVTLDGVAQAGPGQNIAWISPDEGYAIGF